MIIAPRLYRRLLAEHGGLPLGAAVWGDTLIELPREPRGPAAFRSVLDGRELQPHTHDDGIGFLAADALAEFPVAVLAAGCDGELLTRPATPG